jgi:hypothetical protein
MSRIGLPTGTYCSWMRPSSSVAVLSAPSKTRLQGQEVNPDLLSVKASIELIGYGRQKDTKDECDDDEI